METETSLQDTAIKKWRFFMIFWPLLCFIFAGIVIFYPGMEAENRMVGAAFAIIPLIFFMIGMCMIRRLLKERKYATTSTIATVVSIESKLSASKNSRRVYFPIYEFQIGEESYHVKSPSGYSSSCVSKGQQVDLYYNPQDPLLFYVPIIQKRDKRWAVLLCGVGVAYPIIGLVSQILSTF